MIDTTSPAPPSTTLCRRIGRRLRHLRELRGMSQDTLANRAEMTARRLSLCEQGRLCGDNHRQIMAEELYRLSLHLSVPITYFYDDSHAIEDSLDLLASNPDLGAEAFRLVRAFNGIVNDRVRRELFHLIAATAHSKKSF